MTAIRDGERRRLQSAQIAAYNAICVVSRRSVTPDAYGEPVATWTPDAAQPCGYAVASGDEVHEQGEVVIFDSTCRLPAATAIDGTERVLIVSANGAPVGIVHSVVGVALAGHSGRLLKLKRVTSE